MTPPLAVSPRLRLPATMLAEQVQALHRHLRQCDAARGPLFGAAVLVERAHALVAPRFVTTVSVAAVLLAVFSWWA